MAARSRPTPDTSNARSARRFPPTSASATGTRGPCGSRSRGPPQRRRSATTSDVVFEKFRNRVVEFDTMTSEETAVGGRFRTTLWTVVLAAKDPASPQRREALETLIRTYWKPLYSFIRRRGNDPESSQDITQGFFTALLEKNF